MAKSMLIISRQAPWSGLTAREALDIALAGGAFDLPIALLFMDDGVFQLAPDQLPTSVQQKNLTANLQALPLFGIEELYVCQASLAERGLDAEQLTLPVQRLADTELSALLDHYDQVVTL